VTSFIRHGISACSARLRSNLKPVVDGHKKAQKPQKGKDQVGETPLTHPVKISANAKPSFLCGSANLRERFAQIREDSRSG